MKQPPESTLLAVRVLIVDDEASICNLLSHRLKRAGCVCYTAENGEIALALLAEKHIDMVITDIHMPGIDGVELTRRIKAASDVDVIVMTGHFENFTYEEIINAGANDFVQKPVGSQELILRFKRVLRERAHLNQAQEALKIMRHAKEQAESANRAKNQFIANMSHELRTPLNGVMGMLALAANQPSGPQQAEYLQMGQMSAEGLLRVINDILDFSRIEAGKLNIEIAPLNVSEVMAAAMQPLEIQAKIKKIRYDYVIREDVPDQLLGDAGRLRQILLNLFGNALKFTETGSVVGHVEVENRTAQTVTLHFQIRDTGIGVDEEKIGEIFNAFTQADASLTRNYGGLGLGLSICKRLVRMMAGRIWVQSTPGVGSCFHFTADFALARATGQGSHEHDAIQSTGVSCRRAESKQNRGPNPIGDPARQESGLNILLVDDHAIGRQFARDLLVELGHRVTAVVNGKLGIEAIARDRFDLVLMDLEMPEMDGYEAARTIRRLFSANCFRIPIIALTAHTVKGVRERCFNAGMDGHIGKPFSIKQLRGEIDRVTRREPHERWRCAPVAEDPQIFSKPICENSKALITTVAGESQVSPAAGAFLAEVPKQLNRLYTLISEADAERMADHLGSFKRQAVSAGATKLADELFRLQLAVRKLDWDHALKQHATLKAEFKAFRKEVLQHIA